MPHPLLQGLLHGLATLSALLLAGLVATRLDRVLRPLGRLLLRLPLQARVRLPTDPIPASWERILSRNVPLAVRLSASDRHRLLRLMQLFLQDVALEGCAGLLISEEMRVTIAAQACLLLLNMPYPRYHHVKRVLVYPAAFQPRVLRDHPSFEIVQPEPPAAGQAWQSGVVVLAWDDTRRGARAMADGYNVVLHEFAHMLDVEDGAFDGIPVLDSGVSYGAWAAVLRPAFAAHVSAAAEGTPTTLTPYGARSRAEFFAVATEAFFEKPQELRRRQPDLYDRLAAFYRQDPAAL